MHIYTTVTSLCVVLTISSFILPGEARTILGLRARQTRYVQRQGAISNSPEDLVSNHQKSNQVGTNTCQMECDGQGRLCETIAGNVSEKMVCLKNRMQCISACTGKDLRKVMEKIRKKKESEKTKKTIKNLGNSHIFTIEEEIKFYP